MRLIKKLTSSAQLKELMSTYYFKTKLANDTNVPIGYISSGAPVEFFHPLGIIPFYPENHAAMMGATRTAVSASEAVEAVGYSRDICSYTRTDLGSMISGISPIGGMPRPDFILVANNICTTIVKWFEHIAKYYNAPLFIFDMPFVREEVKEEDKDYFKAQVNELVPFLEGVTKKKFEWDRFDETIRISFETSSLWKEILWSGRIKPAPFNGFDGFVHMAPIVTLRGDPEAYEYYKVLKAEIDDRVANGIGAIDNERHRLLWDNIPIWFKLRDISEKLASLDTNIVAATYTNSWANIHNDFDDILGSLAISYLTPYLNSGYAIRKRMLTDMLTQFNADGFIMHSDRSCKPYSMGQYDLAKEIERDTGIPGLVLEGDQVDDRVFADEQAMMRIEAYIENL